MDYDDDNHDDNADSDHHGGYDDDHEDDNEENDYDVNDRCIGCREGASPTPARNLQPDGC